MSRAVIVSTARTPIGKAYRGAFNDTERDRPSAPTSLKAAAQRANVEPDEIEDVVIGCAMPEAEQGKNVARICSLRAGRAHRVRRHDHQPLLRQRPAIHRPGR